MAKRVFPKPPGGPAVRQSTALQQILQDLGSADDGTRAAAVRELCPCRTAWDVPVQRYVADMMNDPSPSVRHEAHHVLDEDSGWGKRLAARRMCAAVREETDADADESPDTEEPSPYSLAWRRRARPLTKGAAARLAWSPRGRK